MESLNCAMAKKTVQKYACSNCWGALKIIPDITKQKMYFVICETCLDETKGYVTKYFVTRRRGESEFEKMDVIKLLQHAGVLQKPNYGTVEENLKALGF